jgi:hypothetical protein
MGTGTESAVLPQLKKAQGETNDRLDVLVAEQKHTNQLPEALVSVIDSHER